MDAIGERRNKDGMGKKGRKENIIKGRNTIMEGEWDGRRKKRGKKKGRNEGKNGVLKKILDNVFYTCVHFFRKYFSVLAKMLSIVLA